ncbi:blastula protease 10-like isoform X1 [Palaemon carinicauda]|uniref:blastula protease 10-like isoform X1 n=1 Tax=Palaemon carinicauda TaxID=392227 RepID=UPI0035B631D3
MAWTEVLLTLLVVFARADAGTEGYYNYTEPSPPDVSEDESRNFIVVDDMFISKEHYGIIFLNDTEKKGLLIKQLLWSKERGYPTVPYNISIDDEKASTNILKAIQHWEDRTCIRFRQATDKDLAHVKFIDGRGCSSAVGKASMYTPQTLKLAQGCREVGVIVHELGHAIGFTHEMMRSDRNDYLAVIEENIVKGHLRNFKMVSSQLYSSYGVPFDYSSIMMYNTRSFTNNGGMTLKTKNPMLQGLPGSFHVLSHRDALLANKMYECIDLWLEACGLDKDFCKNDGYVSRDCTCICPPGTKGYRCERVVGEYYDELMPTCNRVIKKGGTTIQSPKYPRFEDDGTSCVYHIIAPEDHTIEIIFDFFDIFEYRTVRCKLATMIFMEDKINKTLVACGKDFNSKSYKTSTNEIILFFDILEHVPISRGFKCRVEFLSNRTLTTTPPTAELITTTAKTSVITSTASTTVESTPTTMKPTTKSTTVTTSTTTATTTLTSKTTEEPKTTTIKPRTTTITRPTHITTKSTRTTSKRTTTTANVIKSTTPMPATTTTTPTTTASKMKTSNVIKSTTPMPTTTASKRKTSTTTPTSKVTITKPKTTAQPTPEIDKTTSPSSSADSISSKLKIHLSLLLFFLFFLLQFDFYFQ